MTRTKIVATIGPASNSEEMIRTLIEAGMNVARVNFSHNDPDSATEVINRLRKVAKEMDYPLAILGDLQGPKLRLGRVPDDAVPLAFGEHVILTADGADDTIPFPHPELYGAMQPGARLVLGDGEVELTVVENRGDSLIVETTIAGIMGSRKGLNMPGTTLPIPSITDKDKVDLEVACRLDLDYVALSFVRSGKDCNDLRELMVEHGNVIPIIAKIEKSEAIDALQEICDSCEGMMVARGDLGIDLPAYEIPFLQKQIIAVGNKAGKPVITATQMLQSMVKSPVPTRAEATDVANAILDGSDAVMLSNESAMGAYPKRSVEMMRSIAETAEAHFPYGDWNRRRYHELSTAGTSVSQAISSASCAIAHYLDIKYIVVNTVSGFTAQKVARYRPETPIIALTPKEETRRLLNMVSGVETFMVKTYDTMDAIFEHTVKMLVSLDRFEVGDRVAITAGSSFHTTVLTNLLQVHEFTEEDFA